MEQFDEPDSTTKNPEKPKPEWIVENDYELVIKASKEIQYRLERVSGTTTIIGMGAVFNSMTKEAEKTDKNLHQFCLNIKNKFQRLSYVRNQLCHNHTVTAVIDRDQFIEDCEDLIRLLDEKLQRDGYYLLHF